MNILVTIIIPCKNEEKTILHTIDSLFKQDYKPIEVIIVDDGSRDNTVSKLISFYNFLPAKIEKEDYICTEFVYNTYYSKVDNLDLFLLAKINGGKADALNAGINYSHGEYITCIDSDCILRKTTIKQLVSCIEIRDNVVAVGGRVSGLRGLYNYLKNEMIHLKDILSAFQSIEYAIAFLITRPVFDKMGTSLLISGAIGIFKKDTLLKIKGYRRDTYGEDMDLIFRIRKYYTRKNEDYSIKYSKEAICVTELPFTFLDFAKQRIRWTIGLSEVLKKHPSLGISHKYSFLQRLTYWYYLLFEKHMPLFELIWLGLSLLLYSWLDVLLIICLLKYLSLTLTIISTWKIIKKALKNTDHIIRTSLRTCFIVYTFLTIYHFMHSSIRLYALIKNFFTRNKKEKGHNSWKSPKRAGL